MGNHNPAVRQVLMNELGLTREVIREEMLEIIREEIRKELRKPEFINLLVESMLKSGGLRWDIVNLSSTKIARMWENKDGTE